MERYTSFQEFWPYYLSEHLDPRCRALHYAGTVTGLGIFIASIATMAPLLIPLALVCGYGPAWIGHFFIENNRPATFQYPRWSFLGDLKMLACFATGRLSAELEALNRES